MKAVQAFRSVLFFSFFFLLFLNLPLNVHADIVITEVLTNAGLARLPDDGTHEDCYEFVELYNTGDEPVDVGGWKLTDGDAVDTISMYDPALYGPINDPDIRLTTVIPAHDYGVIIDPEYTQGFEGQVFDFPPGTVVMTVSGDAALGDGLDDNADPVVLFRYWKDGTMEIISAYGTPDFTNLADPLNFDDGGDDTLPIDTYPFYSVEKRDTNGGDIPGNWELSSQRFGTPGGTNTKFVGTPYDIVIARKERDAEER